MRGVLLVAASVVTAAIVAAVSSTSAAGSRSAGGLDTVVQRLNQDWQSFDFQVDGGRPGNFQVSLPMYDALIAFAPNGKGLNGTPFVPYLASSWKATTKSVIFQLRRDAKCTDGHVLTPLDVLNSMKRWLQAPKRTGAVASGGQIGGWGPGPYHMRANMKKWTFTWQTEKPYRLFLDTFAQLGIICPAGLAAVAADPHALETTPYGSGPYTLASAKHGDQIVYKLRPEWHWGPPGTSTKTMPQTFVYKIVLDETTAANLLLTGALNIAAITGPDVARLEGQSSFTHQRIANYSPVTLAFNQRPGRVTTDARVRLAMVTALDRRQFNQAAYAGRGFLSPSILRPGSECYDPKTAKLFPKTDVEQAKKILEGDGYTYVNGKAMKNGQQLHVVLNATADFNQGPDYIQNVFNQVGIDTTLQILSSAGYGTATLSGNFDIVLQRTGLPTLDPSPGAGAFFMIGPPTPIGGNSATAGLDDPLYTKLFNSGMQSLGQHACSYFAQLQELIVKKSYVEPLVFLDWDQFNTKGVQYSLHNYQPYYIKPA